MKKNFMMIITVFLLIFQLVTVSADTEMLNAFGISTNEAVSKQMTRIEFMKIIAPILQMDVEADTEEVPFMDLQNYQEDTAAMTAIKKLYAFGIIKGNAKSELLPDKAIDEMEAVTMLVRLLGYEPMAADRPYPGGYIHAAVQAGLFKDVSGTDINERLYTLLCNALEISIMEQTGYGENSQYEVSRDKTILNSLMKIHTYKGKVTAIGECALSLNYSTREGTVRVGDFVFEISDELAGDLKTRLGQYVTVYYKEDIVNEQKSLIYFKAKDLLPVEEISLRDINSFVGNTLKYNASEDKEKTISINGAPYIVYNNRPVSFIPTLGKTGTIKLLGEKGNYETVIIEDYYTATVEAVSLLDKKIHLGNSDKKLIAVEDDENIKIYDEKNSSISMEDLNKDDVLSVLESNDKKSFVIYKSSRSVYGKVTQVLVENYRDTVFTISGVDYGLTEEFFASLKSDTEYLEVVADFSLDHFGNVAAVCNSKDVGLKVGYLIAGEKTGSGLENPRLRIFTQSSEVKNFDVDTKLFTVDGVSQNYKSYIETLKIPCLISYETNANGMITSISGASATRKDGLYRFNKTSSGTYRSAINGFGNSVICSPDAKVFVVPGETSEDALDESYYSIESLGVFLNSYNYSNLSFYATREDSLTADIVVYVNSTGGLFDHTSAPVMVDKVVKSMNPNGEIVDEIYVYSDGALTSYQGKPGIDLSQTNLTVGNAQIPLTKLEKGDIVRLGSTIQNEIGGIQMVYDCSEENGYYHTANPYSLLASYKFCFGTVTRIDGDVIEVYFDKSASYEYYNINGTKVVSYNNENGENKIRTGTEDSFIIKDEEHFSTAASKVFIFSSGSVPKCIYLY